MSQVLTRKMASLKAAPAPQPGQPNQASPGQTNQGNQGQTNQPIFNPTLPPPPHTPGAGRPSGGGGGGEGGGPPGGNGGGNGQPVGGGANNFPFALSPARINNDILDYTDSTVIKTYYRAVRPLEPLFAVEAASLKLFLDNVNQRADQFNWTPTLLIPKNGTTYKLTEHYGTITRADVMQYVMQYTGQVNRHFQNSSQIYHCLMESLTKEAKAKLSVNRSQYIVNGEGDGVLLLKQIIQQSHIDTNATITMIRTNLSRLDTKITSLEDNITEFNQYVKTQRDALHARGQTTNDLLINLFKAYRVVEDTEFVQYIKTKQNEYNEGRELTKDKLMQLAETPYQTLVEMEEWKK